MANKFFTWIDDSSVSDTNTQTSTEFGSDSERSAGFESGTPAHSKPINTALRQATLVTCALMDVVAPGTSSFDLRSSRESIATAISSRFPDLYEHHIRVYWNTGSSMRARFYFTLFTTLSTAVTSYTSLVNLMATDVNYQASGMTYAAGLTARNVNAVYRSGSTLNMVCDYMDNQAGSISEYIGAVPSTDTITVKDFVIKH